VNTAINLRKVISRIVWIASAIDGLAYALKFLPLWHITAAGETAIILTDEIGLVISLLILIGAPFIVSGWKLLLFMIGMFVLCYLWFSSVAWWVMVK
jgi:hypothetical protein